MQNVDVQQIIFEGEGRVEIFSFHPENIEREKRGNLFLIGNIKKRLDRHDSNYYLLNSLAAILKKEYYTPSSLPSPQSFEGALKKMNTFLMSIEPEVLGSLEILALALWANQVNFSSIKNPEVLLVREQRIFRLTKPQRQEKALFQYVTKGKIKSQDKLILGTSNLARWLEIASFASRLLHRPFERVKDYLRQERIEIKDTESLGIFQIVFNPSHDLDSLEKGSPLLEEVRQPSVTKIPPSSLQLRLPLLHPKENSAFYSLKHYYLSHWYGKTPGSPFKTLSQSLLISGKRLCASFLAQRYRYQQISRLQLIALTLGASIIVAGIILSISSSGDEERNIPKSSPSLRDHAPGALIEFGTLQGGISPSHGILLGDKGFLISAGTLYEGDLGTKKIEPLLSFQGEIKALATSEKTLFIVVKRQKDVWEVLSFNPLERSVKKEELLWPLETDLIKEVKEYQGNLYFLEGSENQIVKYAVTQLKKPTLWISQKAKDDIQNALDFDVDGSIYIIEGGKNTITQLRLGNSERTIPLPPTIKGDRLFTNQNTKNLYLVDSIKGEVMVIQKDTGTLLSSIHHPELIGMINAQINEAQQTLRIINSKGIFDIKIIQALP